MFLKMKIWKNGVKTIPDRFVNLDPTISPTPVGRLTNRKKITKNKEATQCAASSIISQQKINDTVPSALWPM